MFNVRIFGANLARLRKKRDMTQSELADKLNLTRQAISKYEVGDSFPDISILTLIAEAFEITLNELINLGEPTKGEAIIFSNIAEEINEIVEHDVSDIINLAPLLKPSILNRMVDGLGKQGIDISNIVELARFLNDESVIKLLENATYDTVDEKLIEKIIPFLDDRSKNVIIEKIIDGKFNWHILEVISPYIQYINISIIESAIIDGALPAGAVNMMRSHLNSKNKKK